MNGIARIQKASRRLRGACTALLVVIPLAVALAWRFIDQIPLTQLNLPVKPDPGHPPIVWVLGFLVSMIPAGVVMYAVGRLRRLFGLYARGVIFGPANVACYRRLGWASLVWAGAEFLSRPLHGLVLTWFNPPGQRLLVLGLDGNILLGLFAGAAVLTVAWVMEEGRRIEEEQALIV